MDWNQIIDSFVNPALAAWRAGKAQEAEAIFKQGLVASGSDGYLALTYAQFLERHGRLKEAEEMFELALKKLPLPDFREQAKVGLERVAKLTEAQKPKAVSSGVSLSAVDSRLRYPAEYRTADGRWVRSKSEKIIADWLYNNHIRFEYERKIIEGVTPDFYLPDMDVYIEYWGKDDEAYVRHRRKKEEIYSKLGIRLLSLDDADIKHIDDILRLRIRQVDRSSSITPGEPSVQMTDYIPSSAGDKVARTAMTGTTGATGSKWLNPNDLNVILYSDAGKYVRQIKTVEGRIVRTSRTSKNSIFLNFHEIGKQFFSGSVFFAVILKEDLKGFPFAPEVFYRNKEVRITGLIQRYRQDHLIVVRVPSQVELAYKGHNYALWRAYQLQ